MERPGIDAAHVLTDDPASMLDAAAAVWGTPVESWTVDAVHARPGAETSVSYDVTMAGERVYVVATTASLDEDAQRRAAALRLESEGRQVFVWRHPADPYLAGLADACVPARLAERLTRVVGKDCAVERLEVLVLRPMRRAVLRAAVTVDGHEELRFIKVVRPERAERLLKRHALCTLAPDAVDAGDGIVVVPAAAGVPMTAYLYRPDGPTPLDPAALVRALDTLPRAAVDFERRASAAEQVRAYGDAAIEARFDRSAVEEIVAAVTALAADPPGPVVATHGDFHAANIFLDSQTPPAVAMLIDLDTLGPGYRVDDLACMLGHLHTLPTFDRAGYPDVPQLITQVHDTFARMVPAPQLDARAAAVLLSLAPGADLHERGREWIQTARDLVQPWTSESAAARRDAAYR